MIIFEPKSSGLANNTKNQMPANMNMFGQDQQDKRVCNLGEDYSIRKNIKAFKNF
jgi:hypothetical protein